MNNAAQQSSSISIHLPDGSVRTYDKTVTGFDVAEDIGPGLAKAVVAMKVDDVQRDLSEPLHDGAKLVFLTSKDEEGIDIIRHTITAQVLALAIKELYPSAKLAIGPTIDHGFYYDVDLDDYNISTDDLPKIEAKMLEIMQRGLHVQREMWEREALTGVEVLWILPPPDAPVVEQTPGFAAYVVD
jgi:threonyl-tRNA synthetase